MHEDLRRRALESKKTLSKKQKTKNLSPASSIGLSPAGSRQPSKQVSPSSSMGSSPIGSRAGSRIASRAASRNNSDDEDASENGTLDSLVDDEDAELDLDKSWEAELDTRVERLLARKASADDLKMYLHILQARLATKIVARASSDLFAALLRCARNENSENEAVLALKAVAATAITAPSAGDYVDTCPGPLKSVVVTTALDAVKAEALHTLAVVTFLGSTQDDDTREQMQYLFEVMESDGASAGASDDAAGLAAVVAAAIDGWALLATSVEDVEDEAALAGDALVDALDAPSAEVASAAATALALLTEASYTPIDWQRERVADLFSPEQRAPWEDPDHPFPRPRPRMAPRWPVVARPDVLRRKLKALAGAADRARSRRDRRALHATMRDCLDAVDDPPEGNLETAPDGAPRMRKWRVAVRERALRRVLMGGFRMHAGENEAVAEIMEGE